MTAPLDVWLICGQPVNAHRKSRGCTCGPNDPTARRVTEALNRIADEQTKEEAVPAPPAQHRATPEVRGGTR